MLDFPYKTPVFSNNNIFLIVSRFVFFLPFSHITEKVRNCSGNVPDLFRKQKEGKCVQSPKSQKCCVEKSHANKHPLSLTHTLRPLFLSLTLRPLFLSLSLSLTHILSLMDPCTSVIPNLTSLCCRTIQEVTEQFAKY